MFRGIPRWPVLLSQAQPAGGMLMAGAPLKAPFAGSAVRAPAVPVGRGSFCNPRRGLRDPEPAALVHG